MVRGAGFNHGKDKHAELEYNMLFLVYFVCMYTFWLPPPYIKTQIYKLYSTCIAGEEVVTAHGRKSHELFVIS